MFEVVWVVVACALVLGGGWVGVVDCCGVRVVVVQWVFWDE